jgi:hypothetical protein
LIEALTGQAAEEYGNGQRYLSTLRQSVFPLTPGGQVRKMRRPPVECVALLVLVRVDVIDAGHASDGVV